MHEIIDYYKLHRYIFVKTIFMITVLPIRDTTSCYIEDSTSLTYFSNFLVFKSFPRKPQYSRNL